MNSPIPDRPLPEGWRWAKLGEVCRVFAGGGAPQEQRYFSGDGPYFFRVRDLGIYGRTMNLDSARDRLSPEALAECHLVRARRGTVLFPKSGAAVATNNRALLSADGYIVGHLMALEPLHHVLSEWLYHVVCQIDMMVYADNTGYPSLKKSVAERIIIPLPPLAEQRRIVTRLEEQMAAADRARSAADRMAEAARAMPAALLRDTLPKSGGSLPHGWRWAKLGEVCRIVGGSTPKSNVAEYWGGDICWVTPADLGALGSPCVTESARTITRRGYDSCSTTLVPKGTIVLSTRAPIGHIAIAGTQLCTNQGCKSFVPSASLDGNFLYQSLIFAMDDIRALGAGATFTEVSRRSLSNFFIPLPPLDEQRRIVAHLGAQMAATERARRVAEAQVEATRALSAALLRDAFAAAR